MDRSTLLAVTPQNPLDPAIAIAACRAGTVGIVDLEFALEPGGVTDCLQQLERFTNTPFGIKLGPGNSLVLESLQQAKPARLQWAILSCGDEAWLRDAVTALRSAGVSVLAEAISIDEALATAALPVDGIVLKGNESGGRIGDETSFVLLQHWQATAKQENLADLPFWIQGGIGPNSAAASIVGGAAGVVLEEVKGRIDLNRTIARELRPLTAIAGGRPDQARELEAAGIATFLHVPSPGLLRMFLRDGARRFIFEGRECGGHSSPPAASNFLEGSIAPVVFAKGLLLALAVGLIGRVYPAYRASRLLPSEGLRHD